MSVKTTIVVILLALPSSSKTLAKVYRNENAAGNSPNNSELKMMKTFKQLTFGLVLSLIAVSAIALDEIYTTWYSSVAIKGHDPVGYFLQNAAVKGSKDHKLKWKDVEWHFASADNKALFESDPEKYAPQYGGYCAWAAAQNQVAGVDPEQFSIVGGKLYLNYNEEIKNKWLGDTTGNIADGDKNWPGLLASE